MDLYKAVTHYVQRQSARAVDFVSQARKASRAFPASVCPSCAFQPSHRDRLTRRQSTIASCSTCRI